MLTEPACDIDPTKADIYRGNRATDHFIAGDVRALRVRHGGATGPVMGLLAVPRRLADGDTRRLGRGPQHGLLDTRFLPTDGPFGIPASGGVDMVGDPKRHVLLLVQ